MDVTYNETTGKWEYKGLALTSYSSVNQSGWVWAKAVKQHNDSLSEYVPGSKLIKKEKINGEDYAIAPDGETYVIDTDHNYEKAQDRVQYQEDYDRLWMLV